MKMKNSPKFKKELTIQFKIDMIKLTNFVPSSKKPDKFAV